MLPIDSATLTNKPSLSGLHVVTYWISNFIWDFCMFVVPFFAMLLIVRIFDVEKLITGEAANVMVVTGLLFGRAIIPFTYLLSNFCAKPVGGQLSVLILYVLSGTALMIAGVVLKIIEGVDYFCKENSCVF